MNNEEVQEYYAIPLTKEERNMSLEELEAKYGKGKINTYSQLINNNIVHMPSSVISDKRRPEEHIQADKAINKFLGYFDDENRLVAFALMSSDFTADEVRGPGVVSKEREDAYEEWINSFSGLNGREGIGKKATPIGEAVNFIEVKK